MPRSDFVIWRRGEAASYGDGVAKDQVKAKTHCSVDLRVLATLDGDRSRMGETTFLDRKLTIHRSIIFFAKPEDLTNNTVRR